MDLQGLADGDESIFSLNDRLGIHKYDFIYIFRFHETV